MFNDSAVACFLFFNLSMFAVGDDEDGDIHSGSPPSTPPPPKRTKLEDRSDDRTAMSDALSNVDGQSNETMDETSDPVSSVLMQQSRSGLVITPSQHQNDIDQSYSDDLAEMLEVSVIPEFYSINQY